MANKVAIITGGGRGIGRATSLTLARAGYDVVVASRTLQDIESVVDEIHSTSNQALAVRVDVTDAREVFQMVDAVIDRFNRLDVLVNCAGVYGSIGRVWEVPHESWVTALSVKLFGTLACCQAAIPKMIHAGNGGKIINIAGGGAVQPLSHLSSYACANAALVRLTETLALELRPLGIQVNSVLPGPVNTQIHDELLAVGDGAGPHLASIRALRNGIGGGTVNEVAKLICRLLSPDFDELSGRLVSLRYDQWQSWSTDDISEIMQTDLLTLRRLDQHTIRSLNT